MEYDVILRNGNVYGGGMYLLRNVDLAIKDGKIAKLDKFIEGTAKQEYNIAGKMVSPAFSDVISCDMEQAEEIITKSLEHGTTTVKYEMFADGVWKDEDFRKLSALKEKFATKICIKTVVPYIPTYDSKWRGAAEQGLVDFVGACIGGLDESIIDSVFVLAKEYHLPIEVGVDFTNEPNIDRFLYIIEKTIEEQMQGMVTCDHVTALDAEGLDTIEAAIAVARCARARVNVVSMTSEDMHNTCWERRGTTKVRDLLDAGVSVAIASGRKQSSVCPFGNGSLLEEALLTAQVHKFTTHPEFSKVYEMITYNPAENMLLENYGTNVGCVADLLVLEAPDATEAILDKANVTYVFKAGSLVARDQKIV